MIPTLLFIVTIVFFAMHLLPGDPAIAILGEYASAEALAGLREKLGLNRPLLIQYLSFLGNLIRGDLGTSLSNSKPVSFLIIRMLPYSIELSVSAIIISILIGIPIGILSALKRNMFIDYISRTFALLGFSTPSFYLGILLLIFFSLKLDLFPMIGGGELDDFRSRLYHLVLPAFSLGLVNASMVMRMTRSTLLDIMNEDYIQTARSKGLREGKVIYKHALRNALIPVIAVIGVRSGNLLGGTVIIESLFDWPGLSSLLVHACFARDYPVIQGTLLAIFAMFILISLLIDLCLGLIDPRMRMK